MSEAAITRNGKPLGGLVSLAIEGETTSVTCEPGSPLDVTLYRAAYEASPRLGIKRASDDKARLHDRWAVSRAAEGSYELRPPRNLQT